MWKCVICGLELEQEKVMRNHLEINHAEYYRDRMVYVNRDKTSDDKPPDDISSIISTIESVQNAIVDANDSFDGGGGDFGGGGSSGDY